MTQNLENQIEALLNNGQIEAAAKLAESIPKPVFDSDVEFSNDTLANSLSFYKPKQKEAFK